MIKSKTNPYIEKGICGFQEVIMYSLELICQESKEKLFNQFLGCKESFTPQKEPTIYVVAGGPGSGKTSFRRESFENNKFNEKMHLHEPDEVMLAIPEYQDYIKNAEGNNIEILQIAREKWSDPALILANQMLEEAANSRMDIIYERTCAMNQSYDFLENAKKSGYRIVFYAFYTDIKTALNRTHERAIKEHRTLPDEITITRTKIFAELFPKYIELSDEIYLFKSEDNKFREVLDYSEFYDLINFQFKQQKQQYDFA